MPLLQACLAPAPPDFQRPEQTPPIMLLESAKPPITEVIEEEPGANITFEVEFISEDAGVDVFGLLHRDLGTPDADFINSTDPLPGGTLADGKRPASIPWRIEPFLTGCHSVTFRLTHDRNFSPAQEFEPIDPDDVAVATWWLNLGGDETKVTDCGVTSQ